MQHGITVLVMPELLQFVLLEYLSYGQRCYWPGLPGWPFFRPNCRNLALFQVGWLEKFHLAFRPFSGLVSSWLALTNSFGLLAFLRWKSFTCRKIFYWSWLTLKNSFFFGSNFENFCDKCYITSTPAFWWL